MTHSDNAAPLEAAISRQDLGVEGAVADWIAANPAQAQAVMERYHQLRVEVARRDVNEFIELVAKDEDTGERVVQAPVHVAMQREAQAHDRVVIWSHIEAGKTTQMAVLRPLWRLGNDPSLRIAIVSKTTAQSQKAVGSIQSLIEKSDAVHEIFPNLSPGSKWTSSAFKVKRDVESRDFSVQALGIMSAVLGARLDDVTLDDVLDRDNTLTPAARADVSGWYRANIAGRMTRRGRVVAIGTPWHPEDLYHGFEASGGRWRCFRYPVIDPETGALLWPERWSHERIKERAAELGPLEAARQLYCLARDDGESRFKREWIDRCLARGNGRSMPHRLGHLPDGYVTYTGVDLGASDKKSSDLTVLFTICVHPNGDREVMCVESGQWTAPDIVSKIEDTHERFQSIVLVESNAAQGFIQQFASQRSSMPVLPFTTGKNKNHPELGIEGIGIELFNGKWIIPNQAGQCSPEVDAWIAEMLYYSPDKHTGDRLMASWFAREGSRIVAPVKKKVQIGKVNLHRR